MKILHFYKTYLPDTVGGVEKVINQIIKSTSSLGFTSEVLALSPGSGNRTVEVDGHRVHFSPTNIELASTPLSIAAISQFRQLADKADLIHYHYPYPFADFLHLTSNHNKPALLTYHSDIVRQRNLLKLYRPLQRRFLNNIDHIVATSPNYLQTSTILKKFTTKTSVIPIGLDKKSYPEPSLERIAYWRSRYGQKFFLFIGVLRYYKGLHILIEAMKNSTIPVVIVGAGPLERQLKQHAHTLGASNIHFAGWLKEEDKVALINLSYGIVFPSHLRSEAFGISLLEGAMFGKPMISSEIGTGTTYININNDTGIVVPPDNPAALRQAMVRLWNDADMAGKMGANAHIRYKKLFTAARMGKDYAGLYRQLITRDNTNHKF